LGFVVLLFVQNSLVVVKWLLTALSRLVVVPPEMVVENDLVFSPPILLVPHGLFVVPRYYSLLFAQDIFVGLVFAPSGLILVVPPEVVVASVLFVVPSEIFVAAGLFLDYETYLCVHIF
jgi:hypothetical protein